MATKLYTFANGQKIALTPGEVNAIERLARMNGTSPLVIQYDPGFVQRKTLNNLRNKGVLAQSAERGCFHFAEGLLPVLKPSINSAKPFSLKDMHAPVEAVEPSLGKLQANILRCLQDKRYDGRWTPGCGWVWGNASTTDRILRSLVKKGYVTHHAMPEARTWGPAKYGVYQITDKGIARKLTSRELGHQG